MNSNVDLLECAERARLIGEFQAEGIHVALPIDAGSTSMLASLDPTRGSPGDWISIQVVMAETTADLRARSAEATALVQLTVAVIPRMRSPNEVDTYALTQAESIMVKRETIEPYAIRPGQWRRKLLAATQSAKGQRGSLVL